VSSPVTWVLSQTVMRCSAWQVSGSIARPLTPDGVLMSLAIAKRL
jgi:hypothetical protein